MALTSIEFGSTYSVAESNGFILSMNRGNIGTVSSIETDTNSNSGVLVYKLTLTGGTTEFSFTFVN